MGVPEPPLAKEDNSELLALLRDLRVTPASATNPAALAALIEPHLRAPPTEPPELLIPPVFDLMLLYPNCATVQIACARLLSNLSSSSLEAAKAVADRKGVQLLFHTLLVHKEAKEVVVHTLQALSSVVPVANGIGPTVYQFFGVDVVAATAKAFIDDKQLQYSALNVLLPLAESDDGDDDPAAMRRSSHARAALRNLKNYRQEQELSRLSCRLLHYAIRHADGESLEQLGRIGIVRMLVATVIAWKDDGIILYHAISALSWLSRGDEDCAEQFAEMRGVELSIRTMRRFRRNVDLQLSCVLLLRTLSDIENEQAMLVYTAGGLEAIISCMIENRQNEEIQEHCIWLVDRLAWLRNDVRLKIISVGGVKTITSTLKTHIMNEDLVEMGVRTLRHIRSSR